MKIPDVPQDQDPGFGGRKKICYATDANGKFVAVETSGWSVEEAARDLAWNSIDSDLKHCQERIERGEASPLEFYMKFRQMDAKLLADNMGMYAWRVKWHLRPKKFSKLNSKWIERYSRCLDIPSAAITVFRGERF
jgi:hypothetical protein